jgi:hypothetical protein
VLVIEARQLFHQMRVLIAQHREIARRADALLHRAVRERFLQPADVALQIFRMPFEVSPIFREILAHVSELRPDRLRTKASGSWRASAQRSWKFCNR